MFLLSLTLVVTLFVSTAVYAQAQWFMLRPRPTNVYYVDPQPTHPVRDGKTDSPMDIADIETLPPQPGDIFVLASGAYHTKLEITASGNETHPIIIAGDGDARATIVGKVDIAADHVWLMNVEVTDPENKQMVSSAVNMKGHGVRVINCIIHDTFQGHGINSFYGYRDQVIYGNILYKTGVSSGARPKDELPTDGIRATNHFDKDGVKYVVGNVFIGYDDVCELCRGFSGHSDPDDTEFEMHAASGFHLESNIFATSHAVIGGNGPPSHNNVVTKNFFGESELQIGYNSPTQAEVTENLIAWSYLDVRYLWGKGDQAYGEPSKPSIYKKNRIFHPPVDNDLSRDDDLPLVDLGTAIYTKAEFKFMRGARPTLGVAPFQSNDVFADNVYGSPTGFFRVNAGGVKSERLSLDAFRNVTKAAGASFGVGSTLTAAANMTSVSYLVDNHYDNFRAYYIAFNFAREDDVELDLKNAFPGLEGTYEVFKADERWNNQPLATGGLPAIKTSPIPVNKQRVTTFVVIANKGKDPNFPLTPDAVDMCPRFSDGCESGNCRETAPKCLLASLECSPNGKCNLKMDSAASVLSALAAVSVALLARLI